MRKRDEDETGLEAVGPTSDGISEVELRTIVHEPAGFCERIFKNDLPFPRPGLRRAWAERIREKRMSRSFSLCTTCSRRSMA